MIKIESGQSRKIVKGFKGKIHTFFYKFPYIGSEDKFYCKGEIETLNKGNWNGPSIRFEYDQD